MRKESSDECNNRAERFRPNCRWLELHAPGHQVDLAVSLKCNEQVWLLRRPPMLQQAFAELLVFLALRSPIDNPFAGLCNTLGGLTQLTYLSMEESGFSEFTPACLAPLSRLKLLRLNGMDIADFDVPTQTWCELRHLELEDNLLTKPPGNLSSLRSLECLSLEGQHTDFQITEPLSFRTPWAALAPELLATVFKHLELPDLLRAQLCCRSWHAVLSKPQVRGLWGNISIQLDKFSWDSLVAPDQHPAARLLPTYRWLQRRAPGISTLQIHCKSTQHT
ncbi:hypothetical protein WJX73_004223 [Symbiochloris irregularis]|uniref:F-box domain-containing protein n=1 Tax=Symbiochloris irregularis TaxID=706552 RepID=A0AAW1PC58_9CHLO